MRRKITSSTVTHGYRGVPFLHLNLSCGHSRMLKGAYAWEHKAKTTICIDCIKAKRENTLKP